jgi:hypothetical protein
LKNLRGGDDIDRRLRNAGLAKQAPLAFFAALGGVLCARCVFFVSVVPLNMALTFLRAGER